MRGILKNQKPTFVRRVTGVLAATVLPLIALLLFGSLYSIGVSNRLVAESNRRVVLQWAEQIDQNLEMIERFLSGIVYIEPEFSTMGHAESQLSVYLASYTITQRLETAMSAFMPLGGVFLYSEQDHAWAERFAGSAYSYAQREAMRSLVRGREDWAEAMGKWRVMPVEERYMLACSFGKADAYMVALVDFERLLTVTQEAYHVFYTDGEGYALTDADWAARESILVEDAGVSYAFTGRDARYLTVSQGLARAPARIVLAVSNAGYWDGLTPVQIALLLLSLVAIGVIPLSRWWVRRYLGRPLDGLTSAMRRIKRGELDTQIAQAYPTQELEQVKDTFNDMMSQIHTLKIEAYEREIDRQRIELQYLHLQLRPHFFINCLKSVYACNQRQRYEQAQEMILSISNYIRYLFRDNLKTVTLREELRFVDDYMHIQHMSLTMPPQCEIQVQDTLLDLRVPPFSVESFVENAVKHQWKPERQLHVRVRAVVLEAEDGRYLDITVRDNGGGFPEEVLAVINALPDDIYQERHVGLANLRSRLKLIYADRATLAFYNDEEGAVCEVICPLEENKMEGGAGREHPGCR